MNKNKFKEIVSKVVYVETGMPCINLTVNDLEKLREHYDSNDVDVPYKIEYKQTVVILEEFFEQPLLDSILRVPDEIIMIPKDTYIKLYDYLIQEERYEDVVKLISLSNKVSEKTWGEITGPNADWKPVDFNTIKGPLGEVMRNWLNK